MSSSPKTPSVHLPRSALTTLSHRCASLGDPGIKVLREAGYRAAAEVLAGLGNAAADLPADEFWSRLDSAFRRAGLGSVAFQPVSVDSGAVSWHGSAEATSAEPRTTHCHFAMGLLGGVLSRAADRTVDVVEVRCGGGGTQPCWFVFGSVETLGGVRTHLDHLRTPGAPGAGPAEPVEP